MFSFHKPKVYRSSTGCCICKAKSSSSRFTDSKKYEEDFLECFQLANPRQGEICNACVLLVKRWKKLPAGSDRNWRHVVDARAGPGMKSMTKFKSKNKKPTLTADSSSSTCEKIEKIMKKKKRKLAERESSPALSDHSDEAMKEDVEMQEVADDFLAEDVVIEIEGRSRTASPGTSDCEDSPNNMLLGGAAVSSRRHKAQAMKRRENIPEVSGFVDLTFWKPRIICCGTIYEGPNGEVLIDTRFLKPCQARLANHFHKDSLDPCVVVTLDTTKSAATAITAKTDNSDSSSDSGYDESSNPGAEKESYKKDEYLVVETTTEMITSNRSISNTTNN